MIFKRLSGYWFNHVYLRGGIAKFVLKVRPVKKTNETLTASKRQPRSYFETINSF